MLLETVIKPGYKVNYSVVEEKEMSKLINLLQLTPCSTVKSQYSQLKLPTESSLSRTSLNASFSGSRFLSSFKSCGPSPKEFCWIVC
ncbi:MAG: hypothetical protein M9911_14350 [Saprospiraceae bacterium]|nr:hypothetical protein [Saprospiraceae bacterium]